MLYEQELKTFVEGTTNFFEVAAQQPASIGSPYLMEGSPAVHEYTGVINISGKREGVVYFTAPKAMLTVLLMKSFSCIFISSTVSIALGAVKYTTPSRFPEMLMTPVYSCTAGEPSIRYGEPIEAGCCAATSKKFVVPSTKVFSSCSYSMVGCLAP